MFITTILGIYTHELLTVIFSIISGSLTALLLWYYHKQKNYQQSTLLLLWNAVAFVFLRIIVYDYGLDIVFLLIPPMVAAILLDKKTLQIHGFIYILGVIFLLRYGYTHYPEHPFLHHKSYMIVFGIFSFFVVSFGAVYHYSIEQSYNRLENSDKEKTFLLKEMHHRVKNNLNMINAILGLQENQSKSEEMALFIKQNSLRIKSIALVHELLYQDKNLQYINIEKYLYKLVQHSIPASKRESVYIHLIIENIHLNINDIIHIGIIINEYLTNSIKYAFTDKQGDIEMTLKAKKSHYILEYKDNGVGIKEDFVSGFGFQLVEMSVEHLEGSQKQTHSSDGFHAVITFKGTTES